VKTTPSLAAIVLATAVAWSLAAPEAQGQGLIKLRFAQAQDILSFAPGYIARARFFRAQGIDPQFEILSGGGPVLAAVASGSVEFGLVASVDLISQAARHPDVQAIHGMNYQTIEVIVNSQWASHKNTSKFHALKQRIESMKGAIIASTTPGAFSETMARYLVRQVGLDPARDVQIVPLGGIGPRIAALQSNHAQVLLSSPPAGQQAEAEGWGTILIPSKDLPGFNKQIHQVLVARRGWLARNRGAARRVATALAQANDHLLDNPTDSVALHQQYYPGLSRRILEQGIRSVRTQTIRHGKMKELDWMRTLELLVAANVVDQSVSMKEGRLWTNDYIDTTRLR
jgi:NitT/TauT family transport system substrate-binding protein